MTFFRTLRSWFTKPAVVPVIDVARVSADPFAPFESEPVLFIGAAMEPPHRERDRVLGFEMRPQRNRGRSRGR